MRIHDYADVEEAGNGEAGERRCCDSVIMTSKGLKQTDPSRIGINLIVITVRKAGRVLSMLPRQSNEDKEKTPMYIFVVDLWFNWRH